MKPRQYVMVKCIEWMSFPGRTGRRKRHMGLFIQVPMPTAIPIPSQVRLLATWLVMPAFATWLGEMTLAFF